MIDSLVLGLHIYTAHLDPLRNAPNNNNYGAYVRTLDGWQAGAYRNSLRRTTVYAGHVWETSCGPIHCGAGAFLATGYPAGDLIPLAAVSLRYGAVRLSYTPRIRDKSSAIIHLSAEW